MKVKRINWKNDEPATEKQVAFVQSLVTKRQQTAAATTDKTLAVEVAFWQAVKVPADLTKIEASGLIDDLRYDSGPWLPNNLESALDVLESGGRVTSATRGIMCASVFHDAVNRILEMVA